MNVFKISKGVRRVGHNYGVVVWFVDCGMGMRLAPEDVIRKLGQSGLRKGDWVVIRKGVGEKGVATLVDGLKYVGCKVEVEASGSDSTPSWLPRVDSMIVWWNNDSRFNFTSLRRGQDLVVAEEDKIGEMLENIGSNDLVDKAVVVGDGISVEEMFKWRVRVY